jgi:uncharacterized membrane protein HdeD (DUF308 family)
VFGIAALLMPGATITALVWVFAGYMLLDGICAIIAGFRAARHRNRWGALILEGVADLIGGGIAVVWQLVTVVALVYLMGAWAVVSGALFTAAAFRLRIDHGRWVMVLGGIISVVWE